MVLEGALCRYFGSASKISGCITGLVTRLSPAAEPGASFRTAPSFGEAPQPDSESRPAVELELRPAGGVAVLSPAAESGASFQTAHSFGALAEASENER